MAVNGVSAIFRRPRALFAILGNGAVSLASVGLSVAVARVTSASDFGEFAIAMVAYVFTSGIVRAAFTDSALARPADPAVLARSFRRASLTALLAASALLIWGLAVGSSYFLILAVSLQGVLALEFLRTYDSAVGHSGRALTLSIAWSAATLCVSLTSLFVPIASWLLFAVWAGAGVACGYGAVVWCRVSLRPTWPREATETSAARLFAMDYLVGSGGSALTTALLGLLVDTTVVGGVRGAGTLLGPANLIATTARSLSIPVLARVQSRPIAEFKTAAAVTIGLTLGLAPLLAVLQFLPDSWGTWLLGETWPMATLALLPLAVESLFALIGSIAAAGHRVAFAGRRALTLRISVGVPRPIAVVICAMEWGVSGAAWAMAVIAVVNAAIWWLSYGAIVRKRVRGGEASGS